VLFSRGAGRDKDDGAGWKRDKVWVLQPVRY
jgi:hypothetical protein